MSRFTRPAKVKRDEKLPDEDSSRIEAPRPRVMLNNCERCRRYLYVYCLSSGPFAYLCGRCKRELAEGKP